MDRTGMAAIILGSLITSWTVYKTWFGKNNKK